MRLPLVLVLALSLASCVTAPDSGMIAPAEAIQSAATAAPEAVRGVFVMRVRAVGRRDGNVYLNSEEDYRDQRNLTITVRPPAIDHLTDRFGATPEQFLIGEQVRVDGYARRVRIDFTAQGRPSGKYYFQTHVDVTDAGQLSILTAPVP